MSEYRIRIEPDDDATSPREWSNLGVIAFWHRHYRYDERDKQHPETAGMDPKAFNEWLSQHPEVKALPLFMLDHSGLRFSTRDFRDHWDSGQVGYIFTTPDIVKKLGAPEDQVEQQLRQEVETLDTYVSGGFCGFLVERQVGDDPEDKHAWETVDSCWGFEDEKYAREEAESVVKYYQGQDQLAHEKAMEATE